MSAEPLGRLAPPGYDTLLGLREQLNGLDRAQQCEVGWLPLSLGTGPGSGVSLFTGEPSWVLSEDKCVEGWEESHGGLGGCHSPVLPSAVRGPCRFLLAMPNRVNLYVWSGSSGETVTERSGPSTGTTWGRPSLSLYWTRKESNWPSGTVQERCSESGVGSVTHSVPRRGGVTRL